MQTLWIKDKQPRFLQNAHLLSYLSPTLHWLVVWVRKLRKIIIFIVILFLKECPICQKLFLKDEDFETEDLALYEKTIDVDNEHFFSDHIIRKKKMIGDWTIQNILDPDGRRHRLMQRRSTDFGEIGILNGFIMDPDDKRWGS